MLVTMVVTSTSHRTLFRLVIHSQLCVKSRVKVLTLENPLFSMCGHVDKISEIFDIPTAICWTRGRNDRGTVHFQSQGAHFRRAVSIVMKEDQERLRIDLARPWKY